MRGGASAAWSAKTFQDDADAHRAWYGDRQNSLAKLHFPTVSGESSAEHEIVVYCKTNPEKRIADPLAVIFKDAHIENGSQMQ